MAASSSSHQEIVEYQDQQSRSIASRKLYDAFISHRGPDVKDTLAKQLYDLLKARQCRAFLDREEIEGGDSISSAISNGIRSSLVQIAIFSKGYAESSWCLNELVLMLEQTDALFIPVFYDVEPKELRCTERGAYAAAFSYYQSKEKYLDKVDEWKKALLSAADRSGYELKHHKDNLCEKIVSRVLQAVQQKKKWIPLEVAKYPVGLAELVQDFEISCSETKRNKVRTVGIFGIGGSGKTTLAKELFNRKRSSYHASSFLFDVRESHAKGELHCLQTQLLKGLFLPRDDEIRDEEFRDQEISVEDKLFIDLFSPKGEEIRHQEMRKQIQLLKDLFLHKDQEIKDLEVRSVHEGIRKLKERLGRAGDWRFLIVLDDIDHQDQLDALLPEGILSSGSLVIITTRDQSMLKGVDIRYKMKGLNRDLAKDLFCSHAFRSRHPPIAYERLVLSFMEFCGGLPLSLKVLGAHVYGREKYYWELELEKVKNIPHKDIIQSLKISLDGLDSQEKQILIDIACFFNNTQTISIDMAISIWNTSGWNAELAVETLKNKCLIEIRKDEQRFEMHDHLRDLGRQTAEEKGLGPPRLWKPELLRSMEAEGFKQILAETKGRCLHSFVDSSLSTRITYFIGNLNDSAETELLWLDVGYNWRQIDENATLVSGLLVTALTVMGFLLWVDVGYILQKYWLLPWLDVGSILKKCWLLLWLGVSYYCGLMLVTVPPLRLVSNLALRWVSNLLITALRLLLLWLDVGYCLEIDKDTAFRLGSSLLIMKSIPSCIPLRKLRCLRVENMELWSTFQKQMKSNAQASFELRILRISQHSRLFLPDLMGKFNHLEELYIRGRWEKTDMTSLLQSLQQLNNLRLLELWGMYSLSGNLNLSKGRDSTNFEASTSSLESIKFGCFMLSNLVISGEMCPRLRSLTVCSMHDLNGMDLQELEGLNTLRVDCCPQLETISGLSSLTGLHFLTVTKCYKMETMSGLSSLTGLQFLTVSECSKLETISGLSSLRCLERINIGRCDELQRIEGVEELQGLKSLVIHVHEEGDPSVCNCIYGVRLRRLPSEYTILVAKTGCRAPYGLDVNLFSEVAVAEIESGQYTRNNPLEMRSSGNAITIYALHVSSLDYSPILETSTFTDDYETLIQRALFGRYTSYESFISTGFNGWHTPYETPTFRDERYTPYETPILETPTFRDEFPDRGEWMVTGFLTEHNSNVSLRNVQIRTGFMVTLNKNEEEKALNILQIIVDRLYRQIIEESEVCGVCAEWEE